MHTMGAADSWPTAAEADVVMTCISSTCKRSCPTEFPLVRCICHLKAPWIEMTLPHLFLAKLYLPKTFPSALACRGPWGGCCLYHRNSTERHSAVIKHRFSGSNIDSVWSKQYEIVITLWEQACAKM